MTEALLAVKRELGQDAVILSTREFTKRKRTKSGGAIFVPIVEISAAKENTEPIKKVAQQGKSPFETVLAETVQGDIYKELEEIKSELLSLKKSDAVKVPTTHLVENGFGDPTPLQHINETWLEMKIMLKSLTEMKKADPAFSKDENLVRLYDQLMQSGIDPDTAQHLVNAVKDYSPEVDLLKPTQIQHSLKNIVEGLIHVTGPIDFDETHVEKGPKVIALIGPTGVGKTSTLTKLGVKRQEAQKAVTLVSLDETARHTGETLIQYANQYGIPALKVATWDQLGKLVSQRKKGELILVDTVGRSHLKAGDVSALRGLTSIGIPLETHLVLAANTKGSDLSDMIDRFSVIPIDSLLFTKIDETQSYGSLFSVMGRKRKPVSYFTTGQEIPGDIVLATPKRFAGLVLTNAMQTA